MITIIAVFAFILFLILYMRERKLRIEAQKHQLTALKEARELSFHNAQLCDQNSIIQNTIDYLIDEVEAARNEKKQLNESFKRLTSKLRDVSPLDDLLESFEPGITAKMATAAH